jgi:hypothetical protein
MNGRLTFPAGGVFGAKIVCFGSVESVDITAGYGPEPDVFAPGLLGDSEPYKFVTKSVHVSEVLRAFTYTSSSTRIFWQL